MAYSYIQDKIGICIDCEKLGDKKPKPLIAGRCKAYHYKLHRSSISLEKRKSKLFVPKEKVRTEESKVRGLIDHEENKRRYEQELWFKKIAIEIENKPYCWEDGTYIPKKFYRAATSHIFPKSLFPSVATHPMNYLILGAGCGCHDKTHRIDTFSKMKIFPVATEHFYQFEKEIKEHHKYLDLFKEAIKNYNQ